MYKAYASNPDCILTQKTMVGDLSILSIMSLPSRPQFVHPKSLLCRLGPKMQPPRAAL